MSMSLSLIRCRRRQPDSALSAEMLAKYESVALLVDRATAVQPAFTVHDGNRDAVARLCARLDGLPLAIELAATRLRSLSVEQVADRLDDRFRLLNRGQSSRDAAPADAARADGLEPRAVFGQERQLWARLSVFPGDFDLNAAEATCAGSGLPREVIVDRLDGLVAKSVISARPETPVARYQMLETIRQYGRELLTRAGLTRHVQRQASRLLPAPGVSSAAPGGAALSRTACWRHCAVNTTIS